jgi:hypothetical protein
MRRHLAVEEFPPPGGGTWSRMGDEPTPRNFREAFGDTMVGLPQRSEQADNVGEAAIIDDGDNLVEDLLHADEELSTQTRDIETTAAVLEHLDDYAIVLESMIENDECTPQALQLVETGINNELARMDETMELPAMEADTTPAQRGQMALEFLRDWFHRVATNWVLQRKHSRDFWNDLIRSVESRVGKYRARLDKGKAEYEHKKDGWHESQHTGNLVEMWYHFATDNGDAKRLIPEIEKDVKMSAYVLIEYPKKVSELYKKSQSVLGSAKVTDEASALRLGKAIEALQHPAALFDRSMIGGKPFLSVTGLEVDMGTKRKPVSIGGTTLAKLSELASPKKVVESGSWKHTAMKIAKHTVASSVGTGANMTIKFTTQDVGTVIDAGFQYLEHVDAYLKQAKDFEHAGEGFEKIFQGFESSVPQQMHSGREVAAMIRQIQQYLENIEECFKSPATKEMARSIKGAKYCDYMSLRMIYQAR